jgi:hypothetical protein
MAARVARKRCPVCGKVQFRDEAAAIWFAQRSARLQRKQLLRVEQTYLYRCQGVPTAPVHLTRMSHWHGKPMQPVDLTPAPDEVVPTKRETRGKRRPTFVEIR